MAIEVIRTGTREPAADPDGIIDVSELPTKRVEEIARGRNVHFERRGDRTFLIP